MAQLRCYGFYPEFSADSSRREPSLLRGQPPDRLPDEPPGKGPGHGNLKGPRAGGETLCPGHPGVPCFTLRDSTERPATITFRTNELVKLDPEAVVSRVRVLLDGDRPSGNVPPWDAQAAQRVVKVLERVV